MQLVTPNAVAQGATDAEANTASPATARSACPIQTVFMQDLLVTASRGAQVLISNGRTKESSSIPAR